MDRYPYLEYIVLLDKRTLARLVNLHYLLHIHKKHNHVNAYQVFGAVAGEKYYLFVMFMLISILSTSLVLQTFVLIFFLCFIFFFVL